MCPKNVKFVVIRCVLSSSKYAKARFWLGLCPGLCWGAYDAPQTPSQLGTGVPLPIPSPLDAFSVSRPPTQISGYACVMQICCVGSFTVNYSCSARSCNRY